MIVRARYLEAQVRRDLRRKMVFVAGPRQVGKTTLAKRLLGRKAGYLNWDVAEHREAILRRELPVSDFWVFDEIHKYMHPLSAGELGLRTPDELRDLLTLGGFPEPFFHGREREARRWSREYRNLLVREEITSLERVTDLGRVEHLMVRLPDLVGSPLSLNALREDLQVSHATVANWIAILERLYAVFRVPPFGAPRIRAVRKEQKHYHLDWSVVPGQPQRFENLVGAHLLKWLHFLQDAEGRDVELRYFRDVDGREVDFVVVEGRRPTHFIECKWADAPIDRSLRYLKLRFAAAEAWQLSAIGTKDFVSPEGIRACPALELLRHLP